MANKVIKSAGPSWRPYRFPPLTSTLTRAPGGSEPRDAAELQRAIADGFHEGVERGYQEGLAQGQEAGRREGLEQGREEGRHQGLEEGRAQGAQEFAAIGDQLSRMIAEFERYQSEVEHTRREELLELVRKVAEQVIRVELTLHPTQLLSLAEEALAAMPGKQEDVRILLNPEECARIKDLAPEKAEDWRLVPQEGMALGECRVVTASAEADVGCQQRLDSCMQALSGHVTGEDEGEHA